MARLRWNRVERACAAVAQIAVVYPLYLAGLLYLLARADPGRLIDVAVAQRQAWVFLAVSCGALLLLAFGLWLRRRRPDSLLFQHLASQYFGLSLVWVGYLTGALDFAAGVMLMGAAITGYIVLDRRVILPALLVAFGCLLVLNLASALGRLPYAPLFAVSGQGSGLAFRALTTFFLSAPHIVFCSAATSILLNRWRRDEDQAVREGITDELTGVPNRRAILERLSIEEARAREHNAGLAVALLDLDHFKQLNDTRGHLEGDRALRECAHLLRGMIGERGHVGRFGGEEFLFVLPGMTGEQAQALMEAYRRRLEALELLGGDGVLLRLRGSFGVAAHPGGPGLEAGALVRAADRALYRAKERGRNRVEQGPQDGEGGADSLPDCVQHTREESGLSPDDSNVAVAAESAKELPAMRVWLRDRVAGVQRWSPEAMTVLLLGLTLGQYLVFLSWGMLTIRHGESGALLNTDFAARLPLFVIAVLALLTVLTLLAALLARNGRHSPLFIYGSHQFYALSMVAVGYLVGILSLPVGIVLLGSPLVGFIFFRRRLVYATFCTSLLAVVALASASAGGMIPYAPLVPEGMVHFGGAEAFWVASFYLFFMPTLVVIIVLADQVLGLWRRRGVYIRALNITDELTLVHSRRHILAVLEEQLSVTRARGEPLGLVIVDLDDFKEINDRRGHAAGDRVLRAAARVLAAGVRQIDHVGRYGGEEFLVVLPGTSLRGALALAERCREELASKSFRDDDGNLFHTSGSFGVAVADPADKGDARTLIKRADDALYRAKAAGRNRVESLEPHAAKQEADR